MFTEIKKLYLSSDYEQGKIAPDLDSTDVIIQMNNGDKHVASFFSYDYIANWEANQKDTSENLNGKFFWAPNMVIVDKCTKENIKEIVKYLIDEGDFRSVFKLLTKPE